jgi:hypothetical protein
MAAQFGDNFPGGYGVVFDGQDAGHRAGLIIGSIRSSGHFAKNCSRLIKFNFMLLEECVRNFDIIRPQLQ